MFRRNFAKTFFY